MTWVIRMPPRRMIRPQPTQTAPHGAAACSGREGKDGAEGRTAPEEKEPP
jgi:hypothetical protein